MTILHYAMVANENSQYTKHIIHDHYEWYTANQLSESDTLLFIV